MFKNNKWRIIISSLVTALPMLFGIIMWERLPNNMIAHFDTNFTPDGMVSKPIAVFALPLIILLVYWLCLFATSFDKKQQEQNPKAFRIIFWIIPIISLFSNGIIYAVAFGKDLSIEIIFSLLFGLMFIFIGNYMPKTKQNRTLGIRIFYTMANEENWNKTHRFAGKVWVIGGVVMLFSALLPLNAMIVLLCVGIFLLVLLPIVYSYKIYKEHKKCGIEYKLEKTRFDKNAAKISAIVVPVILLLTLLLMFTGNIEMNVYDNTLEIKASYFDDISLDVEKINSIEYSEKGVSGARTYGFSSPRLLMGAFRNDEFGTYTRYTYTKNREVIIIEIQDEILVINLSTPEETKELYNTLLEKV